MCITDKTRNLLLQKELRDEHERHTEDELSKQSEFIDKMIHLSLSSRYQSLLRKWYSHICIKRTPLRNGQLTARYRLTV